MYKDDPTKDNNYARKDKYLTSKPNDYMGKKGTGYLKDDIDTPSGVKKNHLDEYMSEREKTKEVIIREALPSMADARLTSLKLKSEKVLGSIFDRVIFLEKRINELDGALKLRESLHADIVKNIEKDIEDKEDMLMFVSDQGEKRNLKMDISILRKEKRQEQIQFWKDKTEISTELQQLLEQFEIEKKITSIFGDLNDQ